MRRAVDRRTMLSGAAASVALAAAGVAVAACRVAGALQPESADRHSTETLEVQLAEIRRVMEVVLAKLGVTRGGSA